MNAREIVENLREKAELAEQEYADGKSNTEAILGLIIDELEQKLQHAYDVIKRLDQNSNITCESCARITGTGLCSVRLDQWGDFLDAPYPCQYHKDIEEL